MGGTAQAAAVGVAAHHKTALGAEQNRPQGSFGHRQVVASPAAHGPIFPAPVGAVPSGTVTHRQRRIAMPTVSGDTRQRYRPYPEQGRGAESASPDHRRAGAGAIAAFDSGQPCGPALSLQVDTRIDTGPALPGGRARLQIPPKRQDFLWAPTYSEICIFVRQARLRGDLYAVRAGDEVVELIRNSLMDSSLKLGVAEARAGDAEPQSLYRALRLRIQEADVSARLLSEGVPEQASCRFASKREEALRQTDNLTHRLAWMLAVRAREFSDVCRGSSRSHAASGRQLLTLSEANSIASFPEHRPADSVSAAAESPQQAKYDWHSNFEKLITQWEEYRRNGNRTAFQWCDATIEHIIKKLTDAYRCMEPESSDLDIIDPIATYHDLTKTLYSRRAEAKLAGKTISISRRLIHIEKLTLNKRVELEARSAEFASLAGDVRSPSVQDTKALESWIQSQVVAASKEEQPGVQKSRKKTANTASMSEYFIRLKQHHDNGRDPWIASWRQIHPHRTPYDRGGLERKMEQAHLGLMRAMAESTFPAKPTGAAPA